MIQSGEVFDLSDYESFNNPASLKVALSDENAIAFLVA